MTTHKTHYPWPLLTAAVICIVLLTNVTTMLVTRHVAERTIGQCRTAVKIDSDILNHLGYSFAAFDFADYSHLGAQLSDLSDYITSQTPARLAAVKGCSR